MSATNSSINLKQNLNCHFIIFHTLVPQITNGSCSFAQFCKSREIVKKYIPRMKGTY